RIWHPSARMRWLASSTRLISARKRHELRSWLSAVAPSFERKRGKEANPYHGHHVNQQKEDDKIHATHQSGHNLPAGPRSTREGSWKLAKLFGPPRLAACATSTASPSPRTQPASWPGWRATSPATCRRCQPYSP